MSEPDKNVKRKADKDINPPAKKGHWYAPKNKVARYSLWVGCACVVAAVGAAAVVATGGLAAGAEGALLTGTLMGGESAAIVAGEVVADVALTETAAGLSTAAATESGLMVAAEVGAVTEIGTGATVIGEGAVVAGGEASAIAAGTGTAVEGTVDVVGGGAAAGAVAEGSTSMVSSVCADLTSRQFWCGMIAMTAAFHIIDSAEHPVDTAESVEAGAEYAWDSSVHACHYVYRKAVGENPDPSECPEEYLRGLHDGDEVSAQQLADRYCDTKHITAMTEDDIDIITNDFLQHHFKTIPTDKDPYYSKPKGSLQLPMGSGGPGSGLPSGGKSPAAGGSAGNSTSANIMSSGGSGKGYSGSGSGSGSGYGVSGKPPSSSIRYPGPDEDMSGDRRY